MYIRLSAQLHHESSCLCLELCLRNVHSCVVFGRLLRLLLLFDCHTKVLPVKHTYVYLLCMQFIPAISIPSASCRSQIGLVDMRLRHKLWPRQSQASAIYVRLDFTSTLSELHSNFATHQIDSILIHKRCSGVSLER